MYKCWGIAARVGVQDYGDTKVLRRFDAVRKSIISLKNIPLTLGHVDNLDTESFKIVGKVLDTFFDEKRGLVLVELEFSDLARLFIEKREFNQLSVGYFTNIKDSTGIWIDTIGITGYKNKQYFYDREQINIECDHLALCNKARAGSVASIFIGKNNINMTENTVQTLLLGLQTGMDKLNLEVDKLLGVKESISTLADSVNIMKDSISLVEKQINTPVVELTTTVEETTTNFDDSVATEVSARLEVAKLLGDSVDLNKSSCELQKEYLTMLFKDSTLNISKLADKDIKIYFDIASQLVSIRDSLPKSEVKLKDTINFQTAPNETDMSLSISNQRKANRK
jgi:hypothetical protein